MLDCVLLFQTLPGLLRSQCSALSVSSLHPLLQSQHHSGDLIFHSSRALSICALRLVCLPFHLHLTHFSWPS